MREPIYYIDSSRLERIPAPNPRQFPIAFSRDRAEAWATWDYIRMLAQHESAIERVLRPPAIERARVYWHRYLRRMRAKGRRCKPWLGQ